MSNYEGSFYVPTTNEDKLNANKFGNDGWMYQGDIDKLGRFIEGDQNTFTKDLSNNSAIFFTKDRPGNHAYVYPHS